ncbi:unnamed protein product [Menidia menidia]|uniref:(Atlantic silverside) hypothetical protein n=1 Tax=Menidia menidia TaxID=238744 RepID=A0A8S4AQH5_9TELE|nr:unnamed protein product [Menidia menidia]
MQREHEVNVVKEEEEEEEEEEEQVEAHESWRLKQRVNKAVLNGSIFRQFGSELSISCSAESCCHSEKTSAAGSLRRTADILV